jgi:hypothetical protein
MKAVLPLVIFSVALAACTSRQAETSVLEEPQAPVEEVFIVNTLNEKAVPDGLLILKGVDSDDELEHALQDNLYGKFFADRAEFFVVEKPLNKIHGSSIQSITLFYLDGQLSKTKYILDNNIANNLIQQFGSFRMVGLDRWNKKLISERRVMLPDKKSTLNPDLDNYEMTWKVGGNLVRYRVSKENNNKAFTYVEGLSNYERVYESVERSIN